MSARTYITHQLATRLSKSWFVSKDPALPDQVTKTTVVVEPSEITRVDGGKFTDHALDAHLIVSATGRVAREDQLEGALDDLLEAVEATPGLSWTTARRTTLADTYHAYTISLQIRMGKEPENNGNNNGSGN